MKGLGDWIEKSEIQGGAMAAAFKKAASSKKLSKKQAEKVKPKPQHREYLLRSGSGKRVVMTFDPAKPPMAIAMELIQRASKVMEKKAYLHDPDTDEVIDLQYAALDELGELTEDQVNVVKAFGGFWDGRWWLSKQNLGHMAMKAGR